jgi:hypothetical protein
MATSKRNPKKEEAPFIPDTPVVTPVSEDLPTSFDVLIKRELTKYDAVVPKIEELSAEFLPLTIVSIEDKEGYEKVSKALRLMVSKRTDVEKKRKELKADSIAFGKAVDERAKEIVEMLIPIEQHLKEEKERIDKELEEIEAQKEQERIQRIKDRDFMLIKAGMRLVGNEYIWNSPIENDEDITLMAINLETFDDIDFNDFFDEITGAVRKAEQKLEAEKLLKEQQQKEKEEQERLEQLKRDEENKKLEEEKRKLDEENKKLRKEMEEMKKMRTEIRLQKLESLGLVNNNGAVVFERFNKLKELIISVDDAVAMDGDSWNDYLEQLKVKVSNLREEDAAAILEAEEKKKSEEERIRKELERIRKEAEERLLKQQKEQEEKEIARKKEEERMEKERIANLSDKEKLSEYATKLLSVERPEMKTITWGRVMKNLVSQIQSNVNEK